MRFPRLAIANYQFTLVVVLLLALLGVVSFFTMPRAEDPSVAFSGSNVIAIYPGATPVDLEQLVVDPLEEALNELEDLKDIETVIGDGFARINVEFLYGTDPDDKYDAVAEKVASLRPELPADLARLEAQKISPQDVNILQVALVSATASYRDLRLQAERLEQQLERVPGVKQVETWAFPEQEVRLALDLETMRERGLSLGQIIQAVQASSANMPGGNLDAGGRRFNIRTSGDYESLDDIRRTVIGASNGRIRYLDDVAEVAFDYEDEQYRGRFNGERAVFITATQRKGANIFDVMGGMQERLDGFEARLPAEIGLHTVFDQSVSVEARVNGFFSNLMQGLLLVGLVVVLALGLRASLIVILLIPLSIAMALFGLDGSGLAIQQMSIVGLVIALGLLVDNAIVVTENVSRFIDRGLTGVQAAIAGTGQIGWAIVSSTVTTILAFLPMILLPSGTGDFIRSMPITVVYALIASLFLSLALTPFLASRFLKRTPRSAGAPQPRAFQRWLTQVVAGPYRRILRAALARPVVVLGTAVLLFAASLALFPIVGVSLFPKAEKPQFFVNIETPEGTSFDRTDAFTQVVEAALAEKPQVARYTTNVGHGNPRVYYNTFPRSETPTFAQIFVEAHSYEAALALAADLRRDFARFPGAEIEVKEFLQGPPIEAPIAIKVIGENLDIIRRIAADVEGIMAQTPGVINLDNSMDEDRTDLRVNINRDKAGLLGIPLVGIDQTVRASMAGLPLARFRDADGEEYPIVARLPLQDRPTLGDFDRISVASATGARIPLRQVARLDFETSPTRIEHYNLERTATLTSDVLDDYNVAAVTQQVLRALDAYDLPDGYRFHIGGEQGDRAESFGGMGQALLLALLGIFGVLVLQFRSFSQPLIVFAAIPFALSGAIVALLLAGYSFSFTAFIGVTSLVGIVVNNSIILVDYANQLRAEGRTLLEAVQLSGETRFTPIVLTTLTTIGGLLPLTLQGSSMWSPMGWVIIGGLVASTVLTLIVVPVLYRLLTPKTVVSAAM